MHTLICGMTESGKTVLGRKLARLHKQQGFSVMVLTAVLDNWEADLVTENNEVFLENFWKSRGAICFIDEAGDTVGRYDEAMRKTATRGRHYGHSCYYITQRASDINKTVRSQCGQVFLFNMGSSDAEALSQEWNQPAFLEAPTLPKGRYIRGLRFGTDGKPYVSKGVAFPPFI